MNRTFLSLILLLSMMVFGSSVMADGEANWVSLDGNSSIGAPSAKVLQSGQNETIIKFTTSGFFRQNITENGVT